MEKIAQVFSNFEDADKADLIHRAHMTPEERIEIFFQLREQSNPDAFKQRLARVHRVLKLEES